MGKAISRRGYVIFLKGGRIRYSSRDIQQLSNALSFFYYIRYLLIYFLRLLFVQSSFYRYGP